MASLSVLDSPNVQLSYPPPDMLATLSKVAATSLTATKDTTGQNVTLTIGATRNVNIEAVDQVKVFTGSNGSYEMYKTYYDELTDARLDEKLLSVGMSGDKTAYVSSASSELKMLANDTNGSFWFNDFSIKNVDDFKVLESSQPNGLWLNDKSSFGSGIFCNMDAIVEQNIFTNGNIAANNLSLFKDTANSNIGDPTRVGYGFRINASQQLELLKYTRFNDADKSDVIKRVMIFGNNPLKSDDTIDTSSQDYTGFSDLANVGYANGKTRTVTFGTSTEPQNGGTVTMNILQYPNAIIELDDSNAPLNIELVSIQNQEGSARSLANPLVQTTVGIKGTITIIERNTTGRAVTTDPQMTFATNVVSTTPSPSANPGSYSVDVIEYIILSPTNVPATYRNKLSFVNFLPPTSSTLGNLTLSNNTVEFVLSEYFSDPQGRALSYMLMTNPLSNARIVSGSLQITGNYRGTSYNVVVRASNGSTQYAESTLAVTEPTAPVPILTQPLGSISIASGTRTFELSSYFASTSGALTYTVVTNPYTNASISSGILTVVANARNATYSITVRATNMHSLFVESTLTVVESGVPVPTISQQFGTVTLSNDTTTFTLSNYFANATSYSVTINPNNNATISSNILTVVGNFRATTYSIVVRGTNSSGYVDLTLTVIETGIIRQYPSSAMTSNNTTVSGAAYGNGAHVVAASSWFLMNDPNTFMSGLEPPWKGFDRDANTMWTNGVQHMYNGTDNTYIGAFSTTASGQTIAGEWIQIQLPQTITISRYIIKPRDGFLNRAAKSFSVVGSTDGTSWTVVDQRTNVSGWAASGKEFTNVSGSTGPFRFYRLIIQGISGSEQWTTINEWELYGF